MRKKVKVFEAGNYGFKGEFPVEKVRDIFSKVEGGVEAQFQHTSKLKDAGKKALGLGEFSNFEISDEGVVTAELEFNAKGAEYYEDGIINGVSIELTEAGIDKIAILPIGVKPHIEGAEFSDEGTLTIGGDIEVQEFALPAWAIVEAVDGLDPIENATEFSVIRDLMYDKMDLSDLSRRADGMGYQLIEKIVEGAGNTGSEFSKEEVEEQVRAKMELEYKAKEEAIKEFSQMEKDGHITSALKEAGLTVEFLTDIRLKQAEATDGAIEFGAGDTSFDVISKIVKSIPKLKMETDLKAKEFSKDDRKARLAKVAEQVAFLQGRK